MAELSALQDVIEEIRTRGATLVAISPQKPEFLHATVRKHHLRFNILFDERNGVARQFNLVWTLPQDLRDIYREISNDLEAYNGDDSWQLPMPARFIIDRQGVVRDVRVFPDHTDRPDPQTIMPVLEVL